jgi:hypothetical protein
VGPRITRARASPWWPFLGLAVELKVFVDEPATVAPHFVVPNGAYNRRRQEPDAWRDGRIEVGELGLEASGTVIDVLTNVLRHARPFVLRLEPSSTVAPVLTGVPLPCNALVAMPTHVLRVRTSARSHVAEALGALGALGAVLTLGGS